MKKKYLVMILFLALSVVGTSFAYWAETLAIDGSITTATFGVSWTDASTNDDYIDDSGLDPGLCNVEYFTYVGGHTDIYALSGDYCTYIKDVAYTGSCGYDDEHVGFMFQNVYPSYAPMVGMRFTCEGSVPAHISDIKIFYNGVEGAHVEWDNEGGMELIAWCIKYEGQVYDGATKGAYTNLPFMVPPGNEGVGVMCMPMLIESLYDIQIHEGESYEVYLVFHFQCEMEQLDAYTFDIEVDWGQYNVVP